jgi:hypothetical protein
MSLEQYAYLAEILGVIVVTATLLYLAVQVRQGAILMRSESRQAMMNNDRDVLLAYLDHQDLFDKIASPEKLSPAEQRRFAALWIVNMRNREHEWFQYKDGILDETTWVSYREIIPIILSSKRHRLWWDKIKSAYDPNFVQMVDLCIAEMPESDVWEQVMADWDQPA